MKVSHIGVAVANIEEAIGAWSALFASQEPHREVVEGQGVSVASFEVGDAVVELTAATGESSPIAKFIGKRGEGIHHVAFEVDDIEAELTRLKNAGCRLINEHAIEGAHGMLVAFVHPSSFNGVLVELCQRKRT